MEQRWQALCWVNQGELAGLRWYEQILSIAGGVEVIGSQKTIILQVRRPVELPSRPHPTFLEVVPLLYRWLLTVTSMLLDLQLEILKLMHTIAPFPWVSCRSTPFQDQLHFEMNAKRE